MGPKTPKCTYSDRFIPTRSGNDFAARFAMLTDPRKEKDSDIEAKNDPVLGNYSLLLKSQLLEGDSKVADEDAILRQSCSRRNLFRYKSKRSRRDEQAFFTLNRVGMRPFSPVHKIPRKISALPYKVLDAPALQDDFYLNLLDWSSLNVLAVGLGSCVYLWSASSSKVTKLCDVGPEDSVTSVSWTHAGTYLAVGTLIGHVQIWDTQRGRRSRTMLGHGSRVCAVCWNGPILCSGSRDTNVLQRDARMPSHYTNVLKGHKSEVCGLQWSHDGRQLASGGNDNQLLIWSLHSESPTMRFRDHTAAVKAVAWSPHQADLLASGGGTADRCIRFRNTRTATTVRSIETGSQVCTLAWSKSVNKIVSTHGYSLNEIAVWRYPNMEQEAILTGHTLRVLYSALSPDGQTICTGAGDETLRFWNVFPAPKAKVGPSTITASSILDFHGRTSVR